MSALRRFLATVMLGVLIVAVAVAAGIVFDDRNRPEAVGGYGVASDDAAQGRAYPGDAEREAALVAAERGRLDLVRQVSTTAPSRMAWLTGPYRVPTTPAPTLVLPPREAAYTVAELGELAPESVAAQDDGSILISENIVVLAGAALDLSSGGQPIIRMLSTPDRFVSIVSLGGGLTGHGSAEAPLTVNSFDPPSGRTDTDTADGRAYVRVIGGTIDLQQAAFEDLGFWSGETGGLALTGTDVPPHGDPAGVGTDASGAPMLSTQDLEALTAGAARPGAVSGALTEVTTSGNAFGLFVSRATQLAISGLHVRGSLVDGIVLNRSVTASTIESSESTGNAVDGIVIERSSSGITMTGVNASQNGRNGISVDARPLALGPSASGAPAQQYGDLHLDGGTIADNAGYGIRVEGGNDITLSNSDVIGSVVGIALDHGSSGAAITANRFEGQSRQAISISGGVEGAISGNRFQSVDTGVRIEDATALVEDNEFTDITNHAVTLAGKATGVRVTGNTIAGDGTAPFYDTAAGGYFARNDVDGWKERVTATSVVRTIAQPLTIVWVALGVLLLFTMVAGYRHHRGHAQREAERRPLTELTPGIVTAEELRGRSS